MTLDGKIALITGGASGIGLASARRFAAAGASVIITDRFGEQLKEVAGSMEDRVDIFQGDISNLKDSQRLHAHVRRRHGQIDVLFANAGVGAVTPLGEVSEQQFDRIMDINVKGTFFTVQALLPLMSDGGSIILTSSVAGSSGTPDFSVYSASKAAIRSFARTWTMDLRHRRIRVNAIAPGTIRTPIYETSGLSALETAQWWEADAGRTPLGRNGTVDEIAAAALFLASDESSYITGIELSVDGGQNQI